MSDEKRLHRIAVISDSHGPVRPDVLEHLAGAELILHGGDIASQKVLDALNQIARVVAVRGNCDKEWAEALPREVLLELYGKKIYMVHNKKHISKKAEGADLIIYGHSHKYEDRQTDGQRFLNPGSCGPRRFGAAATMAMLEFTVGNDCEEKTNSPAAAMEMRVEKIDLTEAAGAADGNLRQAVELVVRDLQRGKTLDQIVKARRLNRELTEQICQIYFTHPGIDVQGVLDRIEIAGL